MTNSPTDQPPPSIQSVSQATGQSEAALSAKGSTSAATATDSAVNDMSAPSANPGTHSKIRRFWFYETRKLYSNREVTD
jgi:hypothetical protein